MPILDTLSIEVTADTASATRKINNLARAMERLSAASSNASGIGALTNSIHGLAEAAGEIGTSGVEFTLLAQGLKAVGDAATKVSFASSSIKKLTRVFEEVSNASEAVDFTAVEQIAEASAYLKSAGSGIGGFARGIDALGSSMDEVSVKAGRFEMFIYGINDASKAIDLSALMPITEFAKTVGTVGTKLDRFAEALNKLSQFAQSSDKVGQVLQLIDTIVERLAAHAPELNALAETLTTVTSSLQKINNIGDIGAQIERARKSIHTMNGAIGDFAKKVLMLPLNAFKSKIQGLIGPLQNLAHSFARIAMYRLLRTVIREITQGFAEGIKHLYEWSRVMDNTFKNSMDSLATSAHYLRDSLGAMASPLIDALAPAIEFVVDKFVALLNIVNQFIATFTGATSWRRAVRTPTEYASGMDEAANSTKKATEAQKKLNKALMDFDEIHLITTSTTKGSNPSSPSGGSGSGEDYSTHFVEEPIADWIKAIKDAIANGDWYGAGAMLADKLNSIIESWDAEGWGRKLGEKVQHGIEFYLGFMDTFNWDELGGKFADFLNGFIDEVNPNDLGRAIVAKFNAAIETINGFTKRFNWEDAGKWLADVLISAFTGLKWKTLGELIKNLAGGILKMLKAGIDELLNRKGEVMSSIGDFFSGLGWDGLKNVVELATIVLGFKALFSAIFGDAGLIAFVKGEVGGLMESAGLSSGLTITCAIALIWAASKIIDNIKEYGADEGLWRSIGIVTPEMTAKLGLDDSGFHKKMSDVFGIWGPVLEALGIDIPEVETPSPAKQVTAGANLPTSNKPTVSQNTAGAMYDPATGQWFVPDKGPTLPTIPSGSASDTLYGSQILYDQTNAIKKNLDYINQTPATLTYKSNNYTTLKNQKLYLMKDLNPTVFWTESGYKKVLEHRTAFAKKITTTVTFKPVVETSANKGTSTTLLSNKQLSKLLDLRAEGGFPSMGSLFVAGEVPGQTEMVGNINGKTGVASGKEITGIADAVYETGADESKLLKELVRIGGQILAKGTTVTLAPNAAAGKWVSQAQTAYARATGG